VRTAATLHGLLVATDATAHRRRLSRKIWEVANDAAVARWGDEEIDVTLHGQKAKINFANPYPYFVRRFPNYNAPQVEIVAAACEASGRPVAVIDVGAAVGDSALLLLERCGDAIESLDCVEGEAVFARLLRQNMNDPRVTVHEATLFDSVSSIQSLKRVQHQGTASAHGTESVEATTLDQLFGGQAVDVLKTDTDGLDGAILAGAACLLEQAMPAVLFEWHPLASAALGTDHSRPFKVLSAAGYNQWVFFNKYGQFSHFGVEHLDELADLCTSSKTLVDWHYDVAALHASSTINPVHLADLRHWGSSGYS
jgi:FkbM family methyltransferase